jgi:hypothetical protein
MRMEQTIHSHDARLFLFIAALFLAACGASGVDEPHWSERPLLRAERNPVIGPEMVGLEGEAGANINGPSVIKVPDWVRDPLGRYYMYFAHHRDTYIRLAVADRPEGPWTIYEPGVLQLDQTAAVDHIASPEVVIDDSTQTIRLYFHGVLEQPTRQRTFVATSTDGLSFAASTVALGLPYFRIFRFEGAYYAIGKRGREAGVLFRSKDGLSPFEEGPAILPRMRHAALHREADRLVIFYSRIGDTPERILRSYVQLQGPWRGWVAGPPEEVLRPEEPYEGVELPILTSTGGVALSPVHELRDPALLVEDRAQYLYYSVAGEQGIAVAQFRHLSAGR